MNITHLHHTYVYKIYVIAYIQMQSTIPTKTQWAFPMVVWEAVWTYYCSNNTSQTTRKLWSQRPLIIGLRDNKSNARIVNNNSDKLIVNNFASQKIWHHIRATPFVAKEEVKGIKQLIHWTKNQSRSKTTTFSWQQAGTTTTRQGKITLPYCQSLLPAFCKKNAHLWLPCENLSELTHTYACTLPIDTKRHKSSQQATTRIKKIKQGIWKFRCTRFSCAQRVTFKFHFKMDYVRT